MEKFELEIRKKVSANLSNNFQDNHDTLRFGRQKSSAKNWVKARIFRNHTSNVFIAACSKKLEKFLLEHGNDAAITYDLLANQQSKNLYLDLICYHILGHKKVKINDTKNFLKERQNFKYKKFDEAKLPVNFNSWTLDNFSFTFKNADLHVFSRRSAIFTEFVADQYTYEHGSVSIGIEEGDYCIDGGGCWGDSSLLFALKAGPTGRVFAFEFIPDNLKILEKNISQNLSTASNIEIVRRPLWSVANLPVWYLDRGPASKVSFEPINSADGKVNTYTIDEFVQDTQIERLDFIKMDIEGAETFALEGAKKSICKFKPKLAICIYHSMDDFTKIAQWLNSLNLGYKFYIKHVTIHWEETVLFAI